MPSPWVTRALNGDLPTKDLTSHEPASRDVCYDHYVVRDADGICPDCVTLNPFASPEYEDFGPVLNEDGSPSDVTLAMFGRGPLA